MAFDRDAIRALYHRRAGRYDRSLWLFRLAGFRFGRYRRSTVSSLGLDRGGTVVDLGCGTGLNFRLLEEAVGPTGTIVGIDLTDAMLDRARARVRSAGWKNVELVRADLAEYTPPEGIAGALSTFAITLVPEYDQVIAHCAAALCPGGLLAICDFKEPPGWPHWLVRLRLVQPPLRRDIGSRNAPSVGIDAALPRRGAVSGAVLRCALPDRRGAPRCPRCQLLTSRAPSSLERRGVAEPLPARAPTRRPSAR